jgi:LysR family transcriptional regulator, hypochlorite-specific transcription factor HypT
MPKDLKVAVVAETALTLAMLQLALKGIGVAWLPQSLVRDSLAQGQLVQLNDILPSQTLSIRILRLNEAQTDLAERVWQELTQLAPLQTSGT